MDTDKLRSRFAGKLILPGHPDYELARRVFNGAIDKRPGAIAQCASVSDIKRALEFAINQSISFTVRGGGHSAAGFSTIDGGLLIDLSQLRSVFVDPGKRIASAEPGATWFDFDRETQAFGLATTGGIISNTGIAGLTLGGGLGWLMGKHGLACDNLVRAYVLLPDGNAVVASENDDVDLLWALRGGGGNFGIVTRFEYLLHPVGPVVAGSLYFPPEESASALRKYRELTGAPPDDITFDFVLATNKAGEKYAVIDGCWSGPVAEGEKYWLKQISDLTPHRHKVTTYQYCEWQQYLDDDLRRGRRSYWKGLYLAELNDEVIEVICRHFDICPSRYTFLTFDHLHGAVRTPSPQSTAFSFRHRTHLFLINTNWEHPEEDEKNIRWANALYAELEETQREPEGYVNYLSSEGAPRIRKSFSNENYTKLRTLKGRYDPLNHFKHNQNIVP
jgi:FAD/FMN-containing dehydrogenase